jgi:hypothetical protein
MRNDTVSSRILRGQAQTLAPSAQEHIPCRTQLIENLPFVIWEDDSENFAKNAQFSGIALQRRKLETTLCAQGKRIEIDATR